VKVPVPPEAVTVAEPSPNPKQVALVVATEQTTGVGSNNVTSHIDVPPAASVTTTEYVPAAKPVAVAAV